MLPRPVPYYRQTAEFSCGGASLVMALHALRGLPVTRAAEFEYWREATTIGVYGIDAWGLTIPAMRRGVPATLIADSDTTFPLTGDMEERVTEMFGADAAELSRFIQLENRRVATEGGAVWEKREPTAKDLEAALATGRVPIPLVDLRILTEEYDAPHWVVGAAIDGDTVTVHDPDRDGPGTRVMSLDKFWRATDVTQYGAPRTLVVLGP